MAAITWSRSRTSADVRHWFARRIPYISSGVFVQLEPSERVRGVGHDVHPYPGCFSPKERLSWVSTVSGWPTGPSLAKEPSGLLSNAANHQRPTAVFMGWHCMARLSTPTVHAILAWLAKLNSDPTVNRFADFWWIRIPVWAARRIPKPFGLVLTDGVYLSAWPLLAAVAPPLALLLGLCFGWLRFAPGDTFTWSITVMALMLVVSSFGAALGAWLWLGYVIGDFFLFKHPVSQFNHTSNVSAFNRTLLGEILHVRVPLLQTYILLAVLLVLIPQLSSRLQGRITARWRQQPRQARMKIAVVVTALLQGLLVYVWTQAVPILTRPLYIWSQYGEESRVKYEGPPVEAMQPLITMGWVLIALAAIAGGVRVVLQNFASARPEMFNSVNLLRSGLMAVRQLSWKLPAWAEILAPAVFITWMLSGLVANVQEAIALAAVLAFSIYARKTLLPRLTAYARLISPMPPKFRGIASLAITLLVGYFVPVAMWKGPYRNTWLPVLISVTLSLITFALLLPDVAGRSQGMSPADTGQAHAPGDAGGRGQ